MPSARCTSLWIVALCDLSYSQHCILSVNLCSCRHMRSHTAWSTACPFSDGTLQRCVMPREAAKQLHETLSAVNVIKCIQNTSGMPIARARVSARSLTWFAPPTPIPICVSDGSRAERNLVVLGSTLVHGCCSLSSSVEDCELHSLSRKQWSNPCKHELMG